MSPKYCYYLQEVNESPIFSGMPFTNLPNVNNVVLQLLRDLDYSVTGTKGTMYHYRIIALPFTTYKNTIDAKSFLMDNYNKNDFNKYVLFDFNYVLNPYEKSIDLPNFVTYTMSYELFPRSKDADNTVPDTYMISTPSLNIPIEVINDFECI
jgi:hypothetical protein